MKLADAEKLATQLMREHGLIDNPLGGNYWRFKFDNAKVRFGYCQHRLHTISLSSKLVLLNEEPRVRNTILHEIAHALCKPGDGHNRAWRQMARAIGCDGQRAYNHYAVAQPPEKYEASCPNCGTTFKTHRRRTKSACARCCSQYNYGRFDAQYLLVWREL
jgi:predicted SprT family Zn-dependent metalloprotease